MKKLKGILVLIFVMFIVAACKQEPTASEKMYDHLEKAVELEQQFVEQQEPMSSLEKQEKELYDQIIDLGSSEMEEIQKLSDEAIDLLNQRREILKIEKESIDQAKTEFDKVESLVEEIEEEEAKAKGNELVTTMDARYSVYNELHEAYSQALDLDQELYNMLKDEELEKDALEAQIENINKKYSDIIELTENFNTKTEEYNNLKKEFYELANIEVEYETE